MSGFSVILIVLYIAALLFKLVTHRGAYQHDTDAAPEHEEPEWSKKQAIIILLLSTIAVAYVSENLVHTFHSVGEQFDGQSYLLG